MAKRRKKPVQYRTRKKSVVPAVVVVLFLLTAAGVAILLFNTPQRRLGRALSSGSKHLAEGSFTQAISAYNKALDIDPACKDAYTGIISAQAALGNEQAVHAAYADARANPDQEGKEELRQEAASRLYAIGEAHFSGGDYDKARVSASLLKDVDGERAQALTDKIVEATAPAVGSVFTVGDLDCRVLERQGNAVLLYAERTVDVRPFTETNIGVSWGYCTLRTWLNKEWVNTLGVEEASRVAYRTVENPAYPNDPESRPHGATDDRVFLLSVQELLQYAPSESDRATGYTYWTRTGTGRSDTKAVFVSENGAFMTGDVRDTEAGVRPAFWYKLN